ncbi:MAG: phosphatidylserine decarboxylase [Verrucomicrobiae bacterium]|nr:phosphatidylserine decarboxylase [Verrucomicrobiae bacterium]
MPTSERARPSQPQPPTPSPSPTQGQPSTLPHAKPFLVWFAVLAAFGVLFQWWWLVVPMVLLGAYVLYFFRTPAPIPPDDPRAIVSPAHGVVTDVMETEEPNYLKGRARRIGIFLSVFDVHVQAAPTDSTLRWTDYRPGKFLDARDCNCSGMNECQWLGFESKQGFHYTVKLIAGLIARRIVLWRPKNAQVARGDLISLIRFGSRVEIFLPPDAEITVKVGERVKGGETIVARKS